MEPDNEEEEIYDASDPKKVAQRLKEDKLRQKLYDEGFRQIISSPIGRCWVWSLMEFSNVFAQSFASDAFVTAFNEGRRSVGNKVMADIQRLAPEMLTTMMRENQEKAYG